MPWLRCSYSSCVENTPAGDMQMWAPGMCMRYYRLHAHYTTDLDPNFLHFECDVCSHGITVVRDSIWLWQVPPDIVSCILCLPGAHLNIDAAPEAKYAQQPYPLQILRWTVFDCGVLGRSAGSSSEISPMAIGNDITGSDNMLIDVKSYAGALDWLELRHNE